MEENEEREKKIEAQKVRRETDTQRRERHPQMHEGTPTPTGPQFYGVKSFTTATNSQLYIEIGVYSPGAFPFS